MVCPNCGAALDHFDSFCPVCGKYSLSLKSEPPEPESEIEPNTAPETEPVQNALPLEEPQETPPLPEKLKRQPKKTPKRLYPPEELLETLEHPEPAKKSSANRKLVIFAVIMGLLAAIAIGTAVYITAHTGSLRVQLRKAQTERASAEASAENLAKEVASLQENLQTTKTEKTELEEQITGLTSQISGMETDVNQAKYDQSTATQKLETIQGEIDTLNGTVDELETKLEDAEAAQEELQTENDSLSAKVEDYESEISFYNSYVVFVMLDSETKYYHKYGCGYFTKQNFLAYSTKLAEANGYSPCPNCIG